MTSSASSYWTARRARESARRELQRQTEANAYAARVERNAVATVLPGYSVYDLPDAFQCLPVIIHNPNGSQTLCRHLV